MNTEPTVSGGCFCGRVRYSSETRAGLSSMCHCRSCQRWTGSIAAMTVSFGLDGFHWDNEFPDTFSTSNILDRHFCARCGTSVGYKYRVGRFSRSQFILVGTLDDPHSVEGPRHYFGVEDHLVKWMVLNDTLPQVRADESPHIKEAFEMAKQRD